MREAAALARSYKVRLHTHLAENVNDVEFSKATFGMEPADYAQDVGWVGDDVPYQITALFAAETMATKRPDAVRAFEAMGAAVEQVTPAWGPKAPEIGRAIWTLLAMPMLPLPDLYDALA